jgi:hypothetical protein
VVALKIVGGRMTRRPPAPIAAAWNEVESALIYDARWFDDHPRTYFLRPAWPHEDGRKPPERHLDAFRIVQRRFTKTFNAPIAFRTDRGDDEIREILAILEGNPKAFER